MDEYLIPTKEAVAEFTEKRSRFIGHIWPVETEEEALACIKQMRETYWDAAHNVYAYILNDGATARYSDDGEPQGTAGMPVLNVLKMSGDAEGELLGIFHVFELMREAGIIEGVVYFIG